jgi:hypothetical protein
MVRAKQSNPRCYVSAKSQSSISSKQRSQARGRDPNLISKANQKKLQSNVRKKMTNTPMKRHRYRPGTVALREIRR